MSDLMSIYRCIFLVLAVGWAAFGQEYGPVPPRPQQFAGATLVQSPRPNFRPKTINNIQDSPRTSAEQYQTVRPRRPQLLRKPSPQIQQSGSKSTLEFQNTHSFKGVGQSQIPQNQYQPPVVKSQTIRPLQEDSNEDETYGETTGIPLNSITLRPNYPTGTPSVSLITGSQLQPNHQSSSQFLQTNAQDSSTFNLPDTSIQNRQPVRQPVRPINLGVIPTARPSIPQRTTPQSESIEEEYYRPIQNTPLIKPEPFRQPVQREPETIRYKPSRTQQTGTRIPINEPHSKPSIKEKKPVAQTINKYHEEHDDGSITWGYENDDGSFKEETIGIDCVTRGKYGYYDPDGVKREYTYQTGIPCLPKTQESEEPAVNQGFVDYTNNKYVLPNGDEIDLEAMVKNRARKPNYQYVYSQ